MAVEQDKLEIEIEVDGGQESKRQVDGVADSVETLGERAGQATTQTRAASAQLEQLARAGQTGAQRLQGVAGAIQSVVSAFGGRDRTAGMVSSVAGATAQFAAMGAMLGPGGTVLGGLAGLVVGIRQAVSANEDLEASTRRAREELSRLASQRLADRAAETLDRDISRGSIAEAGAADLERAREERRIRLEQLETELDTRVESERAARRALEGVGREVSEDRRRNFRDDLERMRDEARDLRREIGNIDSELVGRSGALGTSDGGASGRGGGGGRRDGRAQRGDEQGFGDPFRIDADAVSQNDRLAELAAERLALVEDTLAKEARLRDEAVEEERKRAEEELAIWQRQAAEMERLGQQQEEERRAADERALEMREQTATELTGMFGDVTSAFGKTIASIATGEKSAGDAFKGLAAAFLEMISQYATLKAGTEFAEAGASFARYDYGGGALHIAAGVAFTGVAIATGVGASAINQAPQAPARPEAVPGSIGAGRGGDTIIMWNSPVVTAGTHAELARTIGSMRALEGSI